MADRIESPRGGRSVERLNIAMVSPYSWDVPGGVQFHVRDLAEHLMLRGHRVSVLAPADDETTLPPYVVAAGRAIPVPYNGSVARVSFGPVSATRVRRWLHDGEFDLLHVHEPTTPSLSLLACWAAEGAIVATFHTANPRSRALAAAHGFLQPALEKIRARIAVSEYARRTLVEHLGGDAVLVPNGVDINHFEVAAPNPVWQGTTIGFIGRIDEPRKGLAVLVRAFARLLDHRPQARLLVAGRGDATSALEDVADHVIDRMTFLGQIDEADKAQLLRSIDLYVAPNLGGESFGIILVEAMASGAPVLASDLEAFRAVLDDGRAGELFRVGDVDHLTQRMMDLLDNPEHRAALTAAGRRWIRRYDWSVVAGDLLAVYDTVLTDTRGVVEKESTGGRLGWLRGGNR
jgi:phosphatidyl-myo-inositol alpha-mannosyltransferase